MAPGSEPGLLLPASAGHGPGPEIACLKGRSERERRELCGRTFRGQSTVPLARKFNEGASGLSGSEELRDVEWPSGQGVQPWIELQDKFSLNDVPTDRWEIEETIPELNYLTHNFFRYYGKFPSALAKLFAEEYGVPRGTLIDNYCGCGTSLVEAQLAGMNGVGVDINPLGVLAAKVKTTRWDTSALRESWSEIDPLLDGVAASCGEQDQRSLWASTEASPAPSGCSSVDDVPLPPAETLDKWFSEQAIAKLTEVKRIILSLPSCVERQFFILAFLAIIRRTSFAHDGEVRPHFNPDKEPHDVIEVFRRHVNDMLIRAEQFAAAVPIDAQVEVYLGDNRDLSSVTPASFAGADLALSHPPYLNCFDYFPAFKMGLEWSLGFDEVWQGHTLQELRKRETRAWLSINENLVDDYFEDIRKAYRSLKQFLKPGAPCGIVIGDCTVRGQLVRVHVLVAMICQAIGYELERVIYRTTHFGIGKYAYRDRADYHEEDGGKRDAVLVLRNGRK